jgi:hypothetical protein
VAATGTAAAAPVRKVLLVVFFIFRLLGYSA